MVKILITVATGFIGKALAEYLTKKGHQIISLSLHTEISQDVSGFAAVINLAGEPLVPGLWTRRKKEKIFASRVGGARKLVSALAKSSYPPKVFINASAIGYYGDCQEEILIETSLSGSNFLAHVYREWEASTNPLKSCETRIAHARLGLVLSTDGGALKQLLLPVKF